MAGKKILVVDDARIVCAVFEIELGKEGYEVDSAQDGKKALEMAGSKKYDLAFIDFVMPGMDGIQTCKAIKKVSGGTIIAIMTGKIDSDSDWNEIALSGVDDKVYVISKSSLEEDIGKVFYLYKPFGEGKILEFTRKVLQEK